MSSTTVDRLQRLEEEVRGLREEVKAGNALVLAILQKMVPITREDFPIQTLERLKEMDEKLYEKGDTYTPIFKSILNNNIVTNLNKLISPDVIMELNYGGTKKKGDCLF
ncbi:uncharacterized protein LOC119549792 [Drosophila subpulchrella]|uniref:uncharacterized protein LOC119549792 n=1 Tax=Drosophila subpulchrella TaxID=1486046 RepID=UPI0018A14716|nr:uncharacterized protein LOC119549792 [Drosophila subpulchrella]